jgi:hypothetical protein
MNNKSHCVYLLKEGRSTVYKIGHTANLKRRAKALSFERSSVLVIADVIYVDFRLLAIKIEENLLKALAAYSIGGEWFSLPNISVWDNVATECVITAAEAVFSKQYARVYDLADLRRMLRPRPKPLNWLDYLGRTVNLKNLPDSVVSFETYLKSKESAISA